MNTRAVVSLGLSLVIAAPLSVCGAALAEIDHLKLNEIKVTGFSLEKEVPITIEAVAYRDIGIGDEFTLNNAWILSSDTREVVWSLEDSDSEKRSKNLRDFSDEITLPKGRYEVYYSTYWHYGSRSYDMGDDADLEGLGEAISAVVREIVDKGVDEEEYRKNVKEFRINVEGEGSATGPAEVLELHDRLRKGAVISQNKLGNDYYQTLGLSLEKPMDLQIYAIGEITKGGDFDHCWIIDTVTYKKIWSLDYSNSVYAGGARKNRVFKDVVSLPAGRYALFTATDDSHSFDHWNSPPPYDPYFWGVTIQTADPGMAKYVKTTPYEHFSPKDVLLELNRLRDGETRSQGFSLKSPAKLRVYALGEGSESDLFDYSWILNASTREPVWEMDARKTEHGGGATKNRVVDEVVELGKGDYIVYAVTDGSHSFGDWNASPPHTPERWGITLLSVGGSKPEFAPYHEGEKASALASIVMVKNSEEKTERFRLEKAGDVHVYALGEGGRGEMHDYAWIESAGSGEVVWEMTYHATDHAGGARKNRVFDGDIHLAAGEYVVYYASDASHSYEEWNASPPLDPASWGVTVTRAEKK
jgi:hypothetical protein